MISISKRLISVIILLLLMSFCGAFVGAQIFAQEPYMRLVHRIESAEFGIPNPAGIAYSRTANAFLIAPRPNTTDIMILAHAKRTVSSVSLAAAIPNPINMAFDDKTNSLVFFDEEADELVKMDLEAGRQINSSAEAVLLYGSKSFNAKHLKGISVDPATGDAYFLVVPGLPESARIVRVNASAPNRFDGPTTQQHGRIQTVVLNSLPDSQLRGIALNPSDHHLWVVSPYDQKLYELTNQGSVISARDISDFGIVDVRNMVFAPSGDQTDDPTIQSLYIVDSGGSLKKGGIIELSLVPPQPPHVPKITADFTLIQNVHTWEWDPPSPDASGIAYIPSSNHLLVSDGEIDEGTWNPPLWGGANVWEVTTVGSQVREFNTLAFSDEPSGIAYNPNNQHLYTTDDTGTRSVYELDPGVDGLYGTTDDIITSINTNDFGSDDPEGIGYDTDEGHLFMVDGVNREVYEIDPGPNGLFDGTDDIVTHFDTEVLGALDPEGVEFNPDNGHLYILGSNDIIIETTRDGVYVQEFDISSLNAHKPAGLAYGPTSTNPFQKSLYIVYRGSDNDGNPTENDGELFEISIGSFEPSLSINDVAVLEGDNGTVDAVFTVTLSGATQDVVTVDYATADGSATTADNDYEATSGQVSFQPGVTSQTVLVNVNGDILDEPDETFFVNLTNGVNAPIGDDQGIGNILNDDGPELITLSFQEGLSGYDGAHDTWIESTAPDANHGNSTTLYVDGSPDMSSLLYWDLSIIPSGSTVESVDLQFNVLDGSSIDYELYELLPPWVESEATWNEYASGQSWQTAGANGFQDRGSTVLGAINSSSTGLYTFSLNAAGVAVVQSWIDDPSSNHGFIILDYDYTNGVDLSSRETGAVSERPKLTVSYYSQPVLTISDVAVTEGNSGTQNAVFTVTLSAASSQTVTVDYATADSTATTADNDYVSAAGQVSFQPGETSKPIAVEVNGDLANEPDETFVVNLSNPVNATIADSQGVGTITNDDTVTVLVETKIFLEGPYNSSTNEMSTALKDDGVIPEQSPYSEDPVTVSPIPDNIVDWVLVELRESDTGPALASKSAFLRKDGKIVADNGATEYINLNISEGDYYIVIKHRNHLGVMSADPVPLNGSTSTLYDFTTGADKAYGGVNAMTELNSGVYGMFSGDANNDGQIQTIDKNLNWRNEVGLAGYRSSDFDLNGQVQTIDKNLYWRLNVGRGTQLP